MFYREIRHADIKLFALIYLSEYISNMIFILRSSFSLFLFYYIHNYSLLSFNATVLLIIFVNIHFMLFYTIHSFVSKYTHEVLLKMRSYSKNVGTDFFRDQRDTFNVLLSS